MSEHDRSFQLPTADLTRRRFLQGTTLVGFSAFLAACGTSGTGTQAPPAGSPGPGASQGGASSAPQSPSAELNFANWPLYIDTDEEDETKHKTLEDFTAEFGTVVNYEEVINDNDEFFGTIRPALEAGQDSGWDLVVLTDWMAGRLIRLGWVEQMDQAVMPNKVANMQDVYKGVSFDPTDDHHAPWQSGMTGLGYDSEVTGELTSLNSLWEDDPRWTGKVTFLSEMRDTIGLTMLKLGLDPSAATEADADAAVAEIQKALDADIVRAFTGNEYAEDMVSGNVVLAMAWSGDIVVKQAEKASLVWQLPDEGGMLWTDNMLIPKGAANKYTAELFVNFVYDPAIAAQIAAYVNYVTPVKGAKEVLAAEDPEMAENPLIFPPEDVLANVHIFKGLTEDEETHFNEAFSEVTGN
ncbi:MAG TPA: extracellular solute-binding protein [Candidatus Limnocylindrales bacterium]|nr:extracellular solute-binding protein [Candidatus Limnocylindrales bacterium]